MNLRETKEILARIAAVDNRDLSEATATAWHEVIGDLEYTVAVRALKLAQRDPKTSWLQPKHLMEKVHEATAQLNRELQAERAEDDQEWVPCPKPVNFDEMVHFYTELKKVSPWPTEKPSGALTMGTSYTKPVPHYRQLSPLEIDREVRKAAEKVGWDIPEPIWET